MMSSLHDEMEGEITLDSHVEESSSGNRRLVDYGAGSSTKNQSLFDDDGRSAAMKLLLTGKYDKRPSTMVELKQSMFHQITYTKFTQQEVLAWKPMITPKWAMSVLVLVGIFSIPIGIITLNASNNVVQIVHRYDMECMESHTLGDPVSYIQNPSVNHHCNVTLVIPKMMKRPVFVFYELDKLHQNHRRYLRSRSTKQHQGESRESVDSCYPLAKTSEGEPMIPCGLIAWTLFNDTYEFDLVNSTRNPPLHVPVVKTGIAWKSDVDVKFSNKVYPENFPNNLNNYIGSRRVPVGGASLDPALPLSNDENLIVWMRAAPMPHFRKLYGRIEHSLHAGQVINVSIANVYNTYSFKGSKSVVLTTTSFLGGKNPFLGSAYLTIGVLCMLMALVSMLLQLHHPPRFGDHSRLMWNRQSRLCSC